MTRRQRRVACKVAHERKHPVGQRWHSDERPQRVARIAVGRVFLDERTLLVGPLRLGKRRDAGLRQPVGEDAAAWRIGDRMRRLDPEQDRVLFLGQNVEIPVGALADIPDPLLELGQQPLAANLFAPSVEDDPFQMAVRGISPTLIAPTNRLPCHLGKCSPV